MYLDAVKFLMIAQTSAVNTDAESGNLMEITVFDGTHTMKNLHLAQ